MVQQKSNSRVLVKVIFVINIMILTLYTSGIDMNLREWLNGSTLNEGKNPKGGGATAGKLEIVKTPLEKARKYALSILPELDELYPNFDDSYKFAQKQAAKGHTKRKDMPVITSRDVKQMQAALSSGEIDIRKPFGDNTNEKNPFPEGLSGTQAKKFLSGGLKIYDGSDSDDKVSIKPERLAVGELQPIQEQIYFDIAFSSIANDVDEFLDFLKTRSFSLISNDNKVIDGHHRYLAAMLIDPKMKVNVLRIDLPIKTLLKVTTSYGDAIGNKRNK